MKKLTDGKEVAEIAKIDKSSEVRMAALERITDDELLDNIAENSNFADVREKADHEVNISYRPWMETKKKCESLGHEWDETGCVCLRCFAENHDMAFVEEHYDDYDGDIHWEVYRCSKCGKTTRF